MPALEILLNETVAKLKESGAFVSGEKPNTALIDPIVQAVPTMVAIYSFRISPFFTYLNDTARDFYGLENNDASHLSSFFFAKVLHPRTLHVLAHTYQFFYRKDTEVLKLTYRLKNVEGEYEKVYGATRGVFWNDKNNLAYVVCVTCPEKDSALLNAVVGLKLTNLGERQKETLSLVLKGLTNAQIGDEMGISPRTVEKHLLAIYKEAGVGSRAELLQRNY